MSGYIEEIICPKCEYEYAILDVNVRFFEEEVFCSKCGYPHKQVFTNKSLNNKVSTNEKHLNK